MAIKKTFKKIKTKIPKTSMTISLRASRQTARLLKTIPWGKRDRVLYTLLKENADRIPTLAA